MRSSSRGVFAFAQADFEEQAMDGLEPTGQDFLLWSLCRPERLIEIARQFILYDEGGGEKRAIARVNRLHPGKDFGHIIDYYGVVTQLHDAIELYSSFREKFDQEDLALTPELVHAPSVCIDYVIAHEICRLKHPSHGPRFSRLLFSILPDWRDRKEKLERAGTR